MKWIELSTTTDAEGAEAAAALLNELVKGGAVIEETVTPDASSRDLSDSNSIGTTARDDAAPDPGKPFDPARAFTVRAFFSPHDAETLQRAETALWHLAQLRSMTTPQTRELAEEDWAEAWKKYYTLQHIGSRLVIKPSWLEYAPRDHEVIVELDPGMAFGTGLHPTTRMCLAALEERVRPNIRMLDVGTGSGILAIAAAKLGAREILALDLDSIAVDTAAQNIVLNRVENIVRVEQGSLDAERDRDSSDLICANILAEVICDLAPAIGSSLRANGVVVASGILDHKADAVIDALGGARIDLIEKKQEEDWVTVVGVKD